MVIGRIGGYLALGLVGAFLLNALIRPASAIGTGAALQETGSGIGAIGAGIGETLRSIGSGSAKLLDPLFSLKTLIYDTSIPGAANVSPTAQAEGSMVKTGNGNGNGNGDAGTTTYAGGHIPGSVGITTAGWGI
jgi:hypothetical protein